MPKMKINLDQEGGTFEPIPAGEYEAYLHNVEFKTFNSGNTGYNLEFTVAEGQYQGRKVFDNLVLIDNAKWKLAQFWKAITDDTGEVVVDTEKVPSFVGRKVLLKLDTDTYEKNGETRDKNVVKQIKKTLSGGGSVDDLQRAVFASDDDLPF